MSDKDTKLTLDDPVDPSVLEKLDQLDLTWSALAHKNAILDRDKIQIMASMKRVEEERVRVFEALLIERGLSPNTLVNIDPATRLIKVGTGEDSEE